MNGTLDREIRGEVLRLHPDRALSWPARSLLVVADTHFGKSSVFARHGIAVPGGTDTEDLDRIATLLAQTRAQRLLILGDFLHGALPAQAEAVQELRQWLSRLAPVRFELVTGNHDRTASSGWQAQPDWQGDCLLEGPFCFAHDQPAKPADTFCISGHVHPVVALSGLRKRRLRVPVFWEREDSLVLPSFGSFTGGYRIEPESGGRVFAASADQVVELRWDAGRSRTPRR